MNRMVLNLLILGAILAVLRAVLIALLVGVVLALLVALITRPRDTLAFLVFLGLLGLAGAHPLAFIITLGVVVIASILANSKPKAPPQALLTDGRERPTNWKGSAAVS
ncbi:hypothetical protein [Phenylobacterium kunshanense]|uniref:Uncharacterized protein n=1 Tax=Phenylobacterium kunshanense TaxID=1445034 RepID=A0A328BBZ3_9CAUL|nr:hypothetical protein [Phenylobacterium kunshanense]RAK63314.1 hypothetical protein DJ019_16420 [Phenylobacterium kunshanense]